MRRLLLPLVLLGLAQCTYAAAADLPLLVEDQFEDGAARWQPTDPAAWTEAPGRDGKAYTITKQSKYEPPFRSPINISLIKDVVVSDFRLEADVQSTVKEYDHRDMVLVFGYVDDKHFYYVHFGKKTDDHANQIFIVNEAARMKISTKTTEGTPWTDGWHHLKLECTDSDIRAYFDDMKTPAMTASDKTFPAGRVGIGSFDDTGRFDNFRLWGKAEKAK